MLFVLSAVAQEANDELDELVDIVESDSIGSMIISGKP